MQGNMQNMQRKLDARDQEIIDMYSQIADRVKAQKQLKREVHNLKKSVE